jgi:hypothetical protein
MPASPLVPKGISFSRLVIFRLGLMLTLPAASASAEGKSAPADWNAARVVCVGQPPKIVTWINGVKVSEFDGQSYSGANYDKQKVVDSLGRQGSVALQVNGGKSWPEGAEVRWRNI